jgi:formate-dependent nitrite reductase membrane component NrfD
MLEQSSVGAELGAHIWGWEIAVYLFLGGLVAGLMVVSGIAHRRSEPPPDSLAIWGPLLAPLLLAIGGLALFLDLERKLHFFRFYTTFQWTSPMSWGAWILAAVFPTAVLFALGFRGRRMSNLYAALGLTLGIYTGILLGTFGARPLWNTPVLGPLFLVSGISGAVALLALIEREEGAGARLAALDLKLICVEAGILALLLIGLSTGGAAQRAAADLFLGGPYTALFWVLVVLIGLAFPAVLELLHKRGMAQASAYAPVLVLAGGLALRAVFLLAGQASGWRVL